MKTKKTKPITRGQVAGEALSALMQKITASRQNAEKLYTLLEEFECDPDLTAAEKKQLLGKATAAFLLTTDELLKIVTTFSARETDDTAAEQVRVVLSDEVQKWAL